MGVWKNLWKGSGSGSSIWQDLAGVISPIEPTDILSLSSEIDLLDNAKIYLDTAKLISLGYDSVEDSVLFSRDYGEGVLLSVGFDDSGFLIDGVNGDGLIKLNSLGIELENGGGLEAKNNGNFDIIAGGDLTLQANQSDGGYRLICNSPLYMNTNKYLYLDFNGNTYLRSDGDTVWFNSVSEIDILAGVVWLSASTEIKLTTGSGRVETNANIWVGGAGQVLLNNNNAYIQGDGSGSLTIKDANLSAAIPISEAGVSGLVGFTATSIIGALNELRAAI